MLSRLDNRNGSGSKKTNHINILILVRLNPLTDGNMGILANEYSSLRNCLEEHRNELVANKNN